MSTRKPLILVVSSSMDNNRKEDRNEHGLVRMAEKTRNHMGFTDKVELYADGSDAATRMKSALLLDIFRAFSKDIKELRRLVDAGEIRPEDVTRVGFVTTKTYQRITGKAPNTKCNIWISDTIEETVIGADPEFLIFNRQSNRIISAATINGFNRTGKLGHDGAMAEIRPDPAIAAEDLVENMRRILADESLTKQILPFRWAAECFHRTTERDYPVGGHIHIGNPIQIAQLSLKNRELFFKAFNKILDEYLSLPMIRLDGEKGKKRRTESGMGKYGYFGEMRLCNGRLEHRTLSGLWLSHPELAIAVLGTTKAVIDEVFRRVSHNKFDLDYMMPDTLRNVNVWDTGFSRWGDIPLVKDMRCIRSSKEMHKLLNSSNIRAINKTFLKKWYEKMKQMSTYRQYSSYIDKLYAILNAPTQAIQKIDTELQKNWLEGNTFNL